MVTSMKRAQLTLLLAAAIPLVAQSTFAQATSAQATYTTFGSGCNGSGGVPQLAAVPGNMPVIGRDFDVELSNIGAGVLNVPFGVLGFQNVSLGGIPLPFDATSIGMTGCTLYIDHRVVYPLANQGGIANWTFPIPASDGLIGVPFFQQGFVLDAAANPFGLVVTNAGQGTFGAPVPGVVTETFDSSAQLDLDRSAADWISGSATFFNVGGDGRHGDFDYTAGTYDATNDEWVFDTAVGWIGDEQATSTVDNPAGRYQFTKFEVPAGITVRFVGPFPAIIRVCGSCDIAGSLLGSGRDVAVFPQPGSESLSGVLGQAGAFGGPGGGAGGAGGDQCDGTGDLPNNDGRDGDDMSVPAGHAYAGSAIGTAGNGSEMFPTDGLASSIVFNVFSYSGMAGNGGGGGGYRTAGGSGEVIETGRAGADPTPVPQPAIPTAGGSAFPVFPIVGTSVLDHLTLGGSGGGGGGSHTFYRRFFMAGAGGAGGGGVTAFRAGRSFLLASGARIDVSGGAGYQQQTVSGIGGTYPACGGGGSGGTCVVQCGTSNLTLQGLINTRGGLGGENNLVGPLFMGHNRAGNGADGLYRFEATGVVDTSQAVLLPAPDGNSTAILSDQDDMVGFTSKFYATGLDDAPTYTHYEIVATIDGVPTTFSDDPAVGIPALPGAAIQAWFQGQDVDATTGIPDDSQSPTQWYRAVSQNAGIPSLHDGQRTGFRFSIRADNTVASSIFINEASVHFEN